MGHCLRDAHSLDGLVSKVMKLGACGTSLSRGAFNTPEDGYNVPVKNM